MRAARAPPELRAWMIQLLQSLNLLLRAGHFPRDELWREPGMVLSRVPVLSSGRVHTGRWAYVARAEGATEVDRVVAAAVMCLCAPGEGLEGVGTANERMLARIKAVQARGRGVAAPASGAAALALLDAAAALAASGPAAPTGAAVPASGAAALSGTAAPAAVQAQVQTQAQQRRQQQQEREQAAAAAAASDVAVEAALARLQAAARDSGDRGARAIAAVHAARVSAQAAAQAVAAAAAAAARGRGGAGPAPGSPSRREDAKRRLEESAAAAGRSVRPTSARVVTAGAGRAAGEAAAAAAAADTITVRVRDAARREVFFRVRRSTQLRPVMEARRAKVATPGGVVTRFMFDGFIMDPHHTFGAYEIEDQDVIDADDVVSKIEEVD
ncbi:hypothetical protein FOA52_003148 [Chlamydomonas sp. UWO 241]|nr:hypothetical protein FOA52_003148 [Chlamydomonas sp. UWO 241]